MNSEIAAVQQLEQVFRQHHARIIQAAYRITGSVEDAEDVAQTVFLRLARQPHILRDVESVGSYLHRAAINIGLDILRARKMARPVPLEDVEALLAARSISADRSCASSETAVWLRQALARLHPRTAEVFALRYLDEYSNREIAKIVGTSQTMVGVVLFRARRLLKKDFQEFLRTTR